MIPSCDAIFIGGDISSIKHGLNEESHGSGEETVNEPQLAYEDLVFQGGRFDRKSMYDEIGLME